jgi:hypothetical protein
MALCSLCTNSVLSDGMVCDPCWEITGELPQNVPLIAEKIGIPAERWAGNCHGVSLAFVNRFGPHLDTGNPKVVARLRRGWITALGYGGQHSWLELPRGIILDPTLTALQGKEPEVLIWSPSGRVYDPCGWHSIHGSRTVGPAPDVGETDKELIQWDCFDSVDYVAGLLDTYREFYGEDWLQLSFEQIWWLAHLPVVEGDRPRSMNAFFAAEIYERIADENLKVLIPTDAWHYVMDEPYPGEPARPPKVYS